ncbi:regulator protein, partial [Streptomyces sp. NPDC005921]
MSEGLSSVQALSLALQQAIAEMSGLGGLVHWRDPRWGRLQLVTACGLAPRHSALWAVLMESESVAPALAVHRNGFVWVGDDNFATGSSGVAAVPLLKDGGPVGALSVIAAR